MLTGLVVLTTLFLAYVNGANDNFKGVATLYGSGTTSYRRALAWATLTTLAGSLLAIYTSAGLVKQFGGKGLVPDEIASSIGFVLALGFGASVTVLLATILGFPISTTHALTGALVGAGLAAVGRDVNLAKLRDSFVIPLLAGPVASLAATLVLYPLLRILRRVAGVHEESCLCVGALPAPVPVPVECGLALTPGSKLLLLEEHAAKLPQLSVALGTEAVCVRRYQGAFLGISAQKTLSVLHYLTGGAVGFARGLNDAPKIVALLVGAKALGLELGIGLVAVAMAVGGWAQSRRVAETLGKKITAMNAGQAFTGNLVTSILVALGSIRSLPLSTTHVSCGALFGIGVVTGEARWKVIGQILLAWVTTLPIAALLAALFYEIFA
jgi:PiT family inorganic phosphate transporter